MLILQPGDVFADHYRLTRLIDTGGFADVWEAVFLSAGNTVALKIYPRLDEEGGKNIENEYRNQADLSHSHLLIARYFGRHNGYPFLEMRYCSGGNAAGKLDACDEAEIAKCCYHIASALEYLHENNIVHQDIKPNNFLLDSSGNYYLADLGLSLKVRQTIKKFTMSGTAQKSSFTGLTPPAYRAFELYDRTTIGDQPVKASDIWALGASLYEMATGSMPFGEFGGLTQHRDPQPPQLPDKFSAQLNRILEKCLAKDTWERPKAAELAVWAHNYLLKGDYGIPEPSQATIKQPASAHVPSSADVKKLSPATVKESSEGLLQGADNGQKKKGRPIGLYILLTTVVLAALIWAWAHSGTNGSKQDAGKGLVAKTDTPANSKDPGTVVKDPPGTTTGGGTGATGGGTGTKPLTPKPLPPAPDEPKILTTVHPAVGEPPKSGLISIAKIERAPDYLKVYFVLGKQSQDDDKTTFSIYGPENKSNCFFIDADGRQYRLLRISPSGNNLRFGSSRSFPFTATFERIPDQVKVINIIEGEDRDRMNQNYWTFREVHLN